MRRVPPHVVRQVTRHGKTVFYFRIGKGPRIRLPSPDDPTFLLKYASALSGIHVKQEYIQPSKETKTLRWLVSQYRKSSRWANLALNTQKNSNVYFDFILQKSGNFDYRKLIPKHIRLGWNLEKKLLLLLLNFYPQYAFFSTGHVKTNISKPILAMG